MEGQNSAKGTFSSDLCEFFLHPDGTDVVVPGIDRNSRMPASKLSQLNKGFDH